MQKNGMILSIFENKEIGNCSNNGISSRFNQVLLVGDNVPEILFNENSKVFSKNEMDYGRGMSQKQWIETLNL